MNLYDIAIARALSSGGGGGGSSDFTTATVTVVGHINGTFPLLIEEGGVGAIMVASQTYEDTTFNVALYKEMCGVEFFAEGGTVSLSSNIQRIDDGVYLITGDCTITIS